MKTVHAVLGGHCMATQPLSAEEALVQLKRLKRSGYECCTRAWPLIGQVHHVTATQFVEIHRKKIVVLECIEIRGIEAAEVYDFSNIVNEARVFQAKVLKISKVHRRGGKKSSRKYGDVTIKLVEA